MSSSVWMASPDSSLARIANTLATISSKSLPTVSCIRYTPREVFFTAGNSHPHATSPASHQQERRQMRPKLGYEPAAIGGGITSAVLALLVAYGVLDTAKAGLWAVVLAATIPTLQALATRAFTVSVAKLRDAGQHMGSIDAAAHATRQARHAGRARARSI